MNALSARRAGAATRVMLALLATTLALLPGCASDDYGGGNVSTSVSVGVGYGGYYGPGWYGGYYEPYPPVVVGSPDERPDRPDRPDNGGNRPTTLPSDAGSGLSASPSTRASSAPSRPSNVSRATSRPSPRPATRSMPRAGGFRR